MRRGVMDLVSATQISLFGECQRKWAWKYIAKIDTPQHPSAALGTEVDDTQLQPYLRDDRPLDFSRESGYIAAPGLAFLPKPKMHGLEVQRHFVMPSPTWLDGIGPDGREKKHVGFGFQGFIDFWMPSGGMPDIDGTAPVVCDFKTTGNWKYAKTPEQLKTDVQAQLYATWAMYETKARTVDLAWIYFATKGPRKAKRVHLRVHAEHVAEQFSKINDTALEMWAVRTSVTDPLELPPNVEMCEAYGGCPYRDKCNLSPAQFVDAKAAQWARQVESSIMGNTTQGAGTMSLLARLKLQKAGQAAPPKPNGLSPQQLDGQAAADAGVSACNPPAPALPAWATAPVDPIAALKKHSGASSAGYAGTVVGINPPESLLPPAPPIGAVSASADNPPVSASADATKRGPGRPRKATPAPTDDKGLLLATTPNALGAAAAVTNIVNEAPHNGTSETVSVTWAKEKFQPVAYNDFEVGPFEATGSVHKGETLPQAAGRIYYELTAFAEQARAAKAKSYAAMLAAIGAGK